jgi:hypothetical protein
MKKVIIITFVVVGIITQSSNALDIYYIDIDHGHDFYDGLPLDQSKWALPGWGFDIDVEGDGITSIKVTLPDSNEIYLEDFGDGAWGIEDWDFNTPEDLLSIYPMGTYTFSFNDGNDTVSLDHNEPEPGGIANITYPINDANNVPYENPVFTWDDCNGFGEALYVYVKDELTKEEVCPNRLTIDATSQKITGLLSARPYYFGIDVFNSTEGDRTTNGNDSFWYDSSFFYFNHVTFTTMSIPGDFEPDGDVDFADFAVLALAWSSELGNENWNSACNISEPNDNIIDTKDLVVFAQHWLEVKGKIFDSNSTVITNPWLGLADVGDSYSLAGYGTFAGATRTYSLVGTETVMGVNCIIMRVLGHGEIPASEYYDGRIAQDIGENIHILKITGIDGDGNSVSWQADSVNFSPILLPSKPQPGEIFPFWNGEYHKVIALDQTVPQMSTGAGPYVGCMQYRWGDNSSGDTDEKYHCPIVGIVKEVWDDGGQSNGWERIP